MDFRSVLVALIGVAIAGGSAYGAREYMKAQTAVVAVADPAMELVQIVVASQDIAFGLPIQSQMLRYESWPRKAVPPGAFVAIGALVAADGGEPRRTKYALAAGDLLLASKVSEFGEKVTLVQNLGPNSRAMAIKVDAETAVGGFVTPGDTVDILLTQGDSNTLRTVTILQNIKVLGVDQDSNQQNDQPGIARTVTVEVSPEGGQKLALAQKAGSLSLMLRTLDSVIDQPLEFTSLRDLLQDRSPVPVTEKKETVTIRRGNVAEIVEIN
jgi:pilus assembly protein CpaB